MAVMSKLMMTALVAAVALVAAEMPANDVTPDDAALASMIRNATFLERTPEFTDLYIIKTWDKGRQIVIYCNSSSCYKRSGQAVTV